MKRCVAFFTFVTCVAVFTVPRVFAQAPCSGAPVAGIVQDSTAAVIPGATITLDGRTAATSGSDGHFRFGCVPTGRHHLRIVAKDFAARDFSIASPLTGGEVRAVLEPHVEATVDVGDDTPADASPMAVGGAQTISGNQLSSLADDPDDLLRELQQMAAASGSNPASTTITVDGFQGSSKLPAKSSIAYIKVNPDLFSAEYREPPFEGGRVEVYTKPGQSTYHGALFATNGSPWMNARDPFSVSKAALGKQRYGFELSGPVRRKGSDFALDLEHRSIDNFAVVNAITLDASGNQVNTVANVATPQRLWLGSARLDWQLGPKNTFIASYSANVNHLQNVGVGGIALAETGYDSQQYEHALRLTDVTTVSARLMHEARLAFTWTGENDTPNSLAPQVMVAGAFTGGGANLGAQQIHEFNIELDDDAIVSTKKHLLKFGTQLFLYDEHQRLTTNFNGTYIFGGTDTLSGLQQYRLGTPTQFSNVAGNPQVNFNQIRAVFFLQDAWKPRPNLQIAAGMRYYMQTAPTVYNGATPRLGIVWSPDKKTKWQLHAHAGLFAGAYSTSDFAELRRMDGTERVTSLVYNPVYSPANGNPLAGTTPLHSLRTISPHLTNIGISIENAGLTRALPRGWNLSADFYTARIWNFARSKNINSPLDGQPNGPRPGPQNLNILQVQNSGQGGGNVEFIGLEQHTLKRVQLFFGAVRQAIIDDTDDNTFFTPQSSATDVGEFSRRTGRALWQVFGNGTLQLPAKLELSGDLQIATGSPFNITTGFDNNGDGDFNDRPQYAAPGDSHAIATPYGPLVNSGGNGILPRNILPRNKGEMPATVHLDTNLQRTFQLTGNAKAEHPQTLVLNLRSSNVLNHTNVTQVGGVLGSPLFNVPYAADNGRRVEAGLRYTF